MFNYRPEAVFLRGRCAFFVAIIFALCAQVSFAQQSAPAAYSIIITPDHYGTSYNRDDLCARLETSYGVFRYDPAQNNCWAIRLDPPYGKVTYGLRQVCPVNSVAASGGECTCNSGYLANQVGVCYKDRNPPKEKGSQCGQMRGNPCNAGTGAKLDVELVYRGTGQFPLTEQITYNSRAASDPSDNWGDMYRTGRTGYYERRVRVTRAGSGPIPQAVGVKRPDGREWSYLAPTSGNFYTTDNDTPYPLERLVDATNVTTGWRMHANDRDEIETYDAAGRLTELAHRSGQVHTLTYSNASTDPLIANRPGLLIKVTDSFGRQLNYVYAPAFGRAIMLSDPSGAVINFQYDGATGPAFSNNLTSITYQDNKVRYYYYESGYTSGSGIPNLLTGIVDENGVRYGTYKYDSQGRVASTEHALGIDRYAFTYNADGTTTTTDPLQAQRSLGFAAAVGVNKITGSTQPAGSGSGTASSTITYDANGNVASRTDFDGNQAQYQYDLTRNLETKRTEAYGRPEQRTSSTAWHNYWRIPVQIAEPKRVTTLIYNGDVVQGVTESCAPSTALVAGRPIGVLCRRIEQATSDTTGASDFTAAVVGSPRVWSYNYNNVGKVLTATGPRTDVADVTTYAYDTSGNLVSITNAVNQVTALSNYDLNGRVGRIVDPNGLITDLTYSPRGWLTSKTVGGETTGYEYDGVGQLKKVTLPGGSFISYTYDNAHRLTNIADSLGNRIDYALDAMGNRTSEQVKDPGGALARQTTRVYDALNRLQQVTGGVQ